MIRIAVCEDDAAQLAYIQTVVNGFMMERGFAYHIAAFTSGKAFLAAKEDFDIIFMDIALGDMDGIALGREIRAYSLSVKLIYLTGYEQYQREALDLHCFHYLLKPVSEDQIARQLADALAYTNRKEPVVELKTVEGNIMFKVKDIFYLEYCKDRSIVCVTRSKRYLVLAKSFKELEEKIAPYGFRRPHNSFLVNLQHVEKCTSQSVFLTDQTNISLAGRRAKEFRTEYFNYLHQAAMERV